MNFTVEAIKRKIKTGNSDPLEYVIGFKDKNLEVDIVAVPRLHLEAKFEKLRVIDQITQNQLDEIKLKLINMSIGEKMEFLDYKVIRIPKIERFQVEKAKE